MSGAVFATITCLLLLGLATDPASSRPTQEHHPRLLVVNQKLNAVQIVDPIAGKTSKTIPTKGIRGHEAVVGPDGRFVFVPIYGDSGVGKPGTDGRSIEILDLVEERFVGEIDLGRPARPHCVRLGSDGLLYVTAEIGQTVEVIDPMTKKIVGSIRTNQDESHMLVLTKDGKRGYTSNVGAGSVTALDITARKAVRVIQVAKVAQRISMSLDGKLVFTADQQAPRLAVIDTTSNTVKEWIPLPSTGYGTAPTNDGRYLLVALNTSEKVAVVDLTSMKVARTIDVPAGPMEIVVEPNGRVAYVSCFSGGKVAAIDLHEWKVKKLIDTGEGADGLAWLP